MADEQNKFYSSVSEHYSDIFPYNPAQLLFVKNELEALENKAILDIGCATGELGFRLAEAGTRVVGIDLNTDLLQQAKESKQLENLQFKQGNMLDLANDFQSGQFDAVLCFGNTLVHLNDETQVEQMLQGANKILKPGGKLLIQILNYDYILANKIPTLPLIDTEKIQFIREYKYAEESSIIRFKTTLQVKAKNETIANETSLLALQSNVLTKLLQQNGFEAIELFANFKRDAFGGQHVPLVLSCRKH